MIKGTSKISQKVFDRILVPESPNCLFADDVPSQADIISTVEFDHTGNYLATGDKGGRVVLFERNETVCTLNQPARLIGSYGLALGKYRSIRLC